jgi:hypothetical protein
LRRKDRIEDDEMEMEDVIAKEAGWGGARAGGRCTDGGDDVSR